MTYPRLSLRVKHALTVLMLVSVQHLSQLSFTVYLLSLKTPSFLSKTHSLSFFGSCLLLLSPFFHLSPSFNSLSVNYFLTVLLFTICIWCRSSSSSSLSPSPALQLGIVVSRLAQRTGRHMGGLFCNPAGHTTLAQEGVEGEGG